MSAELTKALATEPDAQAPRSSFAVRCRRALPITTVAAALTAAVLGLISVPHTDREGLNLAVIDQTASSALAEQVSDLVEHVFTVEPGNVRRTREAARAALVGDAVGEYGRLYGRWLDRARADGLTMKTSAVAVGVASMTRTTAIVLVFANQTASRRGTDQSSSGAAQIEFHLERVDGRWKIDDIAVL